MALSDTFLRHFADLDDPRVDNYNKRHLLSDILVLTLLGVICGADTWVDIEAFGQAKHDWLTTFSALSHGIPSYDTLGRFYGLLDAEQLHKGFVA